METKSDAQSPRYKRTLYDIRPVKPVKATFSKEEDRATLNRTKNKLSDYPSEILVLSVLTVLGLLISVSNTL